MTFRGLNTAGANKFGNQLRAIKPVEAVDNRLITLVSAILYVIEQNLIEKSKEGTLGRGVDRRGREARLRKQYDGFLKHGCNDHHVTAKISF